MFGRLEFGPRQCLDRGEFGIGMNDLGPLRGDPLGDDMPHDVGRDTDMIGAVLKAARLVIVAIPADIHGLGRDRIAARATHPVLNDIRAKGAHGLFQQPARGPADEAVEPGRGDADPLFVEFREAKIIIGPREHMLAYAAIGQRQRAFQKKGLGPALRRARHEMQNFHW